MPYGIEANWCTRRCMAGAPIVLVSSGDVLVDKTMGKNNRGESARVFEPTPGSKWSGGCARIVAAQWSERSIVDPRLSSNTPCDLVPLQSGSPPLPCSAGAIVSMVPVAAELPTVDGRPHTNPVNRPCVRTMKRLEPPRFGFSKAANASGSVRLLELYVAQPCTIAVVACLSILFTPQVALAA